ncbi:rhamnan synthesis F family protein [Chitinibacteraceae bacterium HSL-7]
MHVLDFGHADEQLSIGHFVSIAEDVRFVLGGEHDYDVLSTFPFRAKYLGIEEAKTKGPIIVEDDVWIGYGSTILSGVTIGQGAVVAAGSVVTKNVPPYSVVGGNPAKVIKYRFEPEVIAKLLKFDYSRLRNDRIPQLVGALCEKITPDNVDDILARIQSLCEGPNTGDVLAPAGRRIAAVCHVYYADLWQEMVGALARLPPYTDVFITTVPELEAQLRERAADLGPRVTIHVSPNRGRDIGPLVDLMGAVPLEQYDYVLKVHTKKSRHLAEGMGDEWREFCLSGLIPEGGVEALLSALDAFPKVGLVGMKPFMMSAHKQIGRARDNYQGVQHWAARLGVDFDRSDYLFCAGSMFWVRGSVLGELRRLGVTQTDFEAEEGQVDGTLAHVMERLFPLMAKRVGLETASVESLMASEPFRDAQYARWLGEQRITRVEGQLFDAAMAAWTSKPRIQCVLLDLSGNMKRLVETIKNLGDQLYKPDSLLILSSNPPPKGGAGDSVSWLHVDPMSWPETLNQYLEGAQCDWLMVLEAGDKLEPQALLLLAEGVQSHATLACAYFDEDVRGEAQFCDPVFKPDFNLDLLRSTPYVGSAFAVRREALAQMGGWPATHSVAGHIELVYRVAEEMGLNAIGHLDHLLHHAVRPYASWLASEDVARAHVTATRAHLTRMGVAHDILPGPQPGLHRVVYQHAEQPLVSIIVPTKDQLPMLRRCVETLLEKTAYPNYELIIVDNNSETPEACVYLDGLAALASDQIRVLRYPHPFNFSAINNAAVREARGEYLVLLNNDTAIIDGGWLDAMLNHAQRPEVGAVGAKLVYPDGRIQHAGVVMGLRGPADHPGIGLPGDAPGYMNRFLVDQNYAVVTAACMMVRKSVYEAVGGMDEDAFKVSYNDVDLALKIRAEGWLTVWTPYALVMHEGSVSQNSVDTAASEAKRKRFEGEQDALYRKWWPLVARDPSYNRNLTLSGNGFEVETRAILTHQPLAWRPVPRVLVHPGDQMGCGHYRALQPFVAMQNDLLIDGAVSWELLPPFELAKFDADSVVLQRQHSEEQIEFIRRMRSATSTFLVYELDDYLPNLPVKSLHRGHMPKDVVKSMRKALSFVDRFVVSTGPLAEAYTKLDLHREIVVVENRLPVPWWSELSAQRNMGRKPRVGWGGGLSHTGDLELIADVVKELAGEVEWVFFGMCPDKLKPYVHEYHEGVPIDQYPAKLASLNLDLALAPLEHNLFNECKSNLRLLEYGACGFPVIATDIVCYRSGLPVTLVKNRFKDWVDAIRSHLADPDASARQGAALREAVLGEWMLSGAHLERWRAAWLPN